MRCKTCGRESATWAGVARDLVSYIPALVVLLLITNSWDQEWLVLGALAMGAGGKAYVEQLKGSGGEATSGV